MPFMSEGGNMPTSGCDRAVRHGAQNGQKGRLWTSDNYFYERSIIPRKFLSPTPPNCRLTTERKI
jgi:hypothetical protein